MAKSGASSNIAASKKQEKVDVKVSEKESGMLYLCPFACLVFFCFHLLFEDSLMFYELAVLCALLPSPTQDMYREVIRAAVKEVDDGSGLVKIWRVEKMGREGEGVLFLCLSLFLLQSFFPILSRPPPFSHPC